MRSRVLALIFVAAAALFATRGAADNQEACTRESLHALRTVEVRRLFDEKRYGEAADTLARYMEEANCYGSLEPELSMGEESFSRETLDDGEELLWAYSDLALAYLKDNRPGACLEIVETRMKEYYSNVLEEVGSAKLKKAFETNKSLCEAKRKELFPEIAAEPCVTSSLPSRAPQTLAGASDLDLTIAGTIRAIQSPAGSGFDCIAVLSLVTTRGLLDGLCETEEECRSDPDSGYGDEAQIQEVYGVTLGTPAKLVQLDYTNDSGACGLPEISLHRDIADKSATVLRVASGISPCVTGTARGEVDSFFTLKEGKIVPRDVSVRWYH